MLDVNINKLNTKIIKTITNKIPGEEYSSYKTRTIKSLKVLDEIKDVSITKSDRSIVNYRWILKEQPEQILSFGMKIEWKELILNEHADSSSPSSGSVIKKRRRSSKST